MVVEVIWPTTGSASVKLVSEGLGVLDQVTKAWFTATRGDNGTFIVVFVWFTCPRCTLTPAEYSITYHWMFMVVLSVVARMNCTVFDEVRVPAIMEPPGTGLLLAVLKMRKALEGLTAFGSVTELVPLPELVSTPLCTSLKVAGRAVVKTRLMLSPACARVKDPAPSEF